VALRLFGAAGATTTRSITLGENISSAEEILQIGRDLLLRGNGSQDLHKGVGMTLAGLQRSLGEDPQLDLFAP